MKQILIIDNNDSFVYNIVEQLRRLGHKPIVWNNDSDINKQTLALCHGIILSPGAGEPQEYNLMQVVITQYLNIKPLLGICLGHQALALHLGAKIKYLDLPKHGHLSKLYHKNDLLFDNIPNPTNIGRYHSIIVDDERLPKEILPIGYNEDNLLMAFKIKDTNSYGLQFHPESIITENGDQMINNWINML